MWECHGHWLSKVRSNIEYKTPDAGCLYTVLNSLHTVWLRPYPEN